MCTWKRDTYLGDKTNIWESKSPIFPIFAYVCVSPYDKVINHYHRDIFINKIIRYEVFKQIIKEHYGLYRINGALQF